MEWFIVAIVMMHEQTYYSKMNKAFHSKEVCQEYYQTNPSVRNDILVMYPEQTGHTLVCLSQEQLGPLEGKQQI